MKTKLDAKTLKTHFTYSWWKYLLVLIVGIFGVDLAYTVTESSIPDSQKIEVIVCGASLDQNFGEYMERVRVNEMPDILATELTVIPNDDTTAIQYLTVRISTQGGDLYILPGSHFDTMTQNGVLLPLEDDVELKEILKGLNLESGWGTERDSREKHLYGIPIRNEYGNSQFSGLEQYFYVDNGYLCLLRYGKNTENALKFLRILCQDMISDTAALNAPRVSKVRITVLGSVVRSGFSDHMKSLAADHLSDSVRLDLSVRSAISDVMNNFYDNQQDIYLIPKEYFDPLAQEGDFLSLENEELMKYLDPAELVGFWTINNQTGASALYGIPLSQLPGLSDYFAVDNGILCARASSDHINDVLDVLCMLCRDAALPSQN